MTTRTVKIAAGYTYGHGHAGDVAATTVQLADDGEVFYGGESIGYVWKGHRTYSPPLRKGSRIVKYHKRVSEWHGDPESRHTSRPIRRDTRQEVIRELLARARDAMG
jgi:hypothetical protein